jgi:hypothetical protein
MRISGLFEELYQYSLPILGVEICKFERIIVSGTEVGGNPVVEHIWAVLLSTAR